MLKRTKLVRVGKLTFRKKVRKATKEEKIDNKKSKIYYRQHKANSQRKAKLRLQKIERNPAKDRLLKIRRLALQYVKTKKIPLSQAVRLAINNIKKINK
jgi:hypothetical protein